MDSRQITSLQGIEYFPELQKLYCSRNQLEQLDVSRNPKLTHLNCNSNPKLIAASNPELIAASNPELIYLDCSRNQIEQLDVHLNTGLTKLYCSYNRLTDLNVASNPELTCMNNKLEQLDVGNNPKLTRLNCSNNQLAGLMLDSNPDLTELLCVFNKLEQLDVSNNPKLTQLDCRSNYLTSLDLSQNPRLTESFTHQQPYPVKLSAGTLDLTTLPDGFEIRKASDWTNGTVTGNTLTVMDLSQPVTYTYDCGNGVTEFFCWSRILMDTFRSILPASRMKSSGSMLQRSWTWIGTAA